MGFFRRRKKRRTEYKELKALKRKIEILNRIPVDYKYRKDYFAFYKKCEQVIKKIIESTSPDDLCDTMLDHYIDSIVDIQIRFASGQYKDHIHHINEMGSKLNGDLEGVNETLKRLLEDLAEIDEQIEAYTKLKEEKNIH